MELSSSVVNTSEHALAACVKEIFVTHDRLRDHLNLRMDLILLGSPCRLNDTHDASKP